MVTLKTSKTDKGTSLEPTIQDVRVSGGSTVLETSKDVSPEPTVHMGGGSTDGIVDVKCIWDGKYSLVYTNTRAPVYVTNVFKIADASTGKPKTPDIALSSLRGTYFGVPQGSQYEHWTRQMERNPPRMMDREKEEA